MRAPHAAGIAARAWRPVAASGSISGIASQIRIGRHTEIQAGGNTLQGIVAAAGRHGKQIGVGDIIQRVFFQQNARRCVGRSIGGVFDVCAVGADRHAFHKVHTAVRSAGDNIGSAPVCRSGAQQLIAGLSMQLLTGKDSIQRRIAGNLIRGARRIE